MEQIENLGGHVPPVPPWFLRLCGMVDRALMDEYIGLTDEGR